MNMFNLVVYYILIGFFIATGNGNLDSKFDRQHKIKSVLYWPTYAMNYFNAVSKINQVDIEQVKRDLAERQLRN